MNWSLLTPLIAAALRHFLVAGGVLKLAEAEDVSNQLAAALVTVFGLGWSFYNAWRKKQQK